MWVWVEARDATPAAFVAPAPPAHPLVHTPHPFPFFVHRDASMDLLSYWCSWVTVLCAAALLLTDYGAKREAVSQGTSDDYEGSDAFVSAILIMTNLALLVLAVCLQTRGEEDEEEEDGEGEAAESGEGTQPKPSRWRNSFGFQNRTFIRKKKNSVLPAANSGTDARTVAQQLARSRGAPSLPPKPGSSPIPATQSQGQAQGQEFGRTQSGPNPSTAGQGQGQGQSQPQGQPGGVSRLTPIPSRPTLLRPNWLLPPPLNPPSPPTAQAASFRCSRGQS